MTYIVLPPARNDLEFIEDWVLSNFGAAAAAKAIDDLIEVFDMLARFPLAGLERHDIYPPPMRFFSFPPNWVIYEPASTLRIHRVFPSRMELRDLVL